MEVEKKEGVGREEEKCVMGSVVVVVGVVMDGVREERLPFILHLPSQAEFDQTHTVRRSGERCVEGKVGIRNERGVRNEMDVNGTSRGRGRTVGEGESGEREVGV